MSKDNLSDEDKLLFRQLMTDVKPLVKSDKIVVPTSRPTASKPVKRRSSSAAPNFDPIYLSNSYREEVQSNAVLSYSSHNIPSKRLHELKKGLIPWQARLDLHGLKPDAARQALVNFITVQLNLANRCLLIIHGKGSLRGEAPVLKNLVNHWLPQFPQVLAFHSALARDGGTGALYLLLKRQKEEKN